MLPLSPHPAGVAAIATFAASAQRLDGGGLRLRYALGGALETVAWPAPGAGERRDELWRHTCCEAFVRVADEEGYREFNFSPAGDWAAYAFTGYRAGMQPLALAGAPAMRWQHGTEQALLEVTLPLELPGAAPLRLALAGVVERRDGALGWWALHHPPGAPDFHHPAAFVVTLPPLL